VVVLRHEGRSEEVAVVSRKFRTEKRTGH
jgi:hypothetical protein